MTDIYFFISSQDSVNVSKNNDPSDFWIQLPKPYTLEGDWVCSVQELSLTLDFKPKSTRLYLCCDLVEDSYVFNSLLPVLRNVEVHTLYKKYKTKEYLHPTYIKVKSKNFQKIRLYLVDQQLKPVQFMSNDLHCVIHLKKQWVR